eukprot:337417-Pyramimonas_sp.AAC.2
MYSRRTNPTQEARVCSHDGPIRRRKRGCILTMDQSDAGTRVDGPITYPLRVQPAVLDDEVEGVVHQTALAPVVERSVTVHQLLLGECLQLARLDGMDALGGARGRERPAGA